MNLRTLPHIKTERLLLKLLESPRTDLMIDFRLANRSFLKPWEPRRPAEFFTPAFWDYQLRYLIQDYRDGNSLCLVIMDAADTEVMGVCNFTNIIRGTFLACQLGYALAEKHQGKGVMFEALTHAIEFVFSQLDLHRIMAAYVPRNARSGTLLKRLNFVIEGTASKYLSIDGRWEDHVLTALVNPDESR
ncbi:MAG: ribosomal protein S5-alanine N-acetyltransferase [Pseudomonadales bacterium]|jgi:ribosomal-protein-alanine N-acetyltransferase|nr:ribosomal protein S5-alanine N-acetyltransferase [Pseudomonadales bacterium]MDP7359698.1 ribosomal protein S5-alanine N-acetyltransferase [Pseudomonadales bacterium]MDP7594261.1 ribosomal protein S5-alanine N-acetyltransferase [Pseudomonadales bacterium]HJN50619.1 ribosomal protein S5-alanine N-acetyltransferase [Pseudomonadales bacterium]|tara:strand:- start:253 stop:819 length:567 start_codon:yes stop_codon:yes gene_type:complete